MEKKLAEILIDELEKHGELIIKPNKEEFVKILELVELKSNVFFEYIPMNKQTLEENDIRCTLELRRVLNNKAAREYTPSALTYLKKIARETSPSIIYSSDALCMKIARDHELVSILEQSEQPYSLLAKQKRYQMKNSHIRNVITKPLLIIPGRQNDLRISCWEGANISVRTSINERLAPSVLSSKPLE